MQVAAYPSYRIDRPALAADLRSKIASPLLHPWLQNLFETAQ